MSYICQTSKPFRRKGRGTYGFKWKSPEGVWKEATTGADSLGKAKEFIARFRRDMEAGHIPNDFSKYKLSDAETWFMEKWRPKNAADTTVKSEKGRMAPFRAFLKDKAGDITLAQIGDKHLIDYQLHRQTAGVSNASINRELSLWISMLQKARLWARLQPYYQQLPVDESDIGQALTDKELAHLENVGLSNPLWMVSLYSKLICANTGLRKRELYLQQIKNIKLESRELDVRKKVLVEGERKQGAKNRAAVRTVPLIDAAVRAIMKLLERYYRICDDQGVEPDPEHFLLPFSLSRQGAKLGLEQSGYDLNRPMVTDRSAWESLRKKAGFPGLRGHDMRHTAITNMRRAGMDMMYIKLIVGHMSKKMVEHYTHIVSGDVQREAQKFNLAQLRNAPSDPSVMQVRDAESKSKYFN